MPHRINGCGTWYHGRKNVVQFEGTCSSCKRRVVLSSYDTRLWFDVVLIPIIPLARKRIIDQCPACTRHHPMSYDDWEQGKKRTIEAIAAYRRKPADPALAEQALKLIVGQRDVPAFLELAPEIERGLRANPKSLVMTASVYEMFGRLWD